MVLCLRCYWALWVGLKLTMAFVSGLKVRIGFVSVIGGASDKKTRGLIDPIPVKTTPTSFSVVHLVNLLVFVQHPDSWPRALCVFACLGLILCPTRL